MPEGFLFFSLISHTGVGNLAWLRASATSALIAALQDEDKYLLGHAATALGKIARDVKAVVPALTNALKDK
jgi:PBS lyase HEAT-like repeat-containing protein